MFLLQILINIVCFITILFVAWVFLVSSKERRDRKRLEEEAELAAIDEFFTAVRQAEKEFETREFFRNVEECRNDFQ